MAFATHGAMAELLPGLKNGLLLGMALLALTLPPAGGSRRIATAVASSGVTAPTMMLSKVAVLPVAADPLPLSVMAGSREPLHANFGDQRPSRAARWLADWVADSGDSQGLAFAVLDKRNARLFVFSPEARLLDSSLVLLGSATGDEALPGIGNKPLAAIRADERVTAAGRFVARPGHDDTGDDVIWVDYDSAMAMHRVKVVDPKERRFERIATPSVRDKRISNGCINVPIDFFDNVVKPALGRASAVVYVLPELRPIDQTFPRAYDVDARGGWRLDRTMVMYRPRGAAAPQRMSRIPARAHGA